MRWYNYNFIIGIGYIGFFVGIMVAKIGTFTSGPSEITWLDAIKLGIIIIIPFFIGLKAKTKKD